MNIKKAVSLLKTQFYPDHHVPYVKLSDNTINQIFEALERAEKFDDYKPVGIESSTLVYIGEDCYDKYEIDLYGIPKNKK